MIRWLIAMLLLTIPAMVLANWMYLPGPGYSQSGGGSTPTYIIEEDGAGTGWTNTAGVAWNVDGSSIGLDSSTVFIQSLTDSTSRTSYKEFDPIDEVWTYKKIYISSINVPSGSYRSIFTINASGSGMMTVNAYNVSGTYRLLVSCGGAGVNTTDTLSEDTVYHIWSHYKKGSGSDAICEVEFSTNGVFSGTGNKFAGKYNGSSTLDVNRIVLSPGYSTTGLDSYYDKIRVDDVVIGSNPQ